MSQPRVSLRRDTEGKSKGKIIGTQELSCCMGWFVKERKINEPVNYSVVCNKKKQRGILLDTSPQFL